MSPSRKLIGLNTIRSISNAAANSSRHVADAKLAPPMPLQLRDYQQEIIEKCMEALDEGKRRIAVSLATGGGKTVIFSKLIDLVRPRNTNGNKTLILVHRRELADQAANMCRKTSPHLRVEIEMGSDRASDEAQIVVASVASLSREPRLTRFSPSEFKMIIIDECHHAAANSYIKILEYFGAGVPETETAVVGFSATIQRNDGKLLTRALDHIIYHRDLVDMINDKWLCDVKFTTVETNTHLEAVKVSKSTGDFDTTSLSAVMNNAQTNELVLKTYSHIVQKHGIKATIVFCVDIDHVVSLTQSFHQHGIDAQYVTGKSHKNVRDEIINDFRNGKIPVLINCGIFTEGTDIPNIDSILLARPTKSSILLTQMIGRGLRLHQEKEYCHIVDFVGVNCDNICNVPTLIGLPPTTSMDGLSLEEVTALQAKFAEQELLDKVTKELERTALSNLEVEKQKLRDERQKEFEKVSLVTYDGFLALLDGTKEAGGKSADQYFQESNFPWIRVNYNSWIIELSPMKIHLRVEETKTSDEVGARPVFFLSRHTENDVTRRIAANFRCGKYSKAEIAHDEDLSKVLQVADSLILQASEATLSNMTKFAKWRLDPVSGGQLRLLKTMLSKLANRKDIVTDNSFKEKMSEDLQGLTKGEAATLLTGLKHGGSLLATWRLKRITGLGQSEKKKISKYLEQTSKTEPLVYI